MKLIEDMREEPYKCDSCSMVFVNSKELTKHEINVHVDKLYQCQACDEIILDLDKFNSHVKSVHSISSSPSTRE